MACTIVDNLLVKVRHGQNAQFTADRATGSGGEIRSFEAENSQYSRTCYTNQLTPIN